LNGTQARIVSHRPQLHQNEPLERVADVSCTGAGFTIPELGLTPGKHGRPNGTERATHTDRQRDP